MKSFCSLLILCSFASACAAQPRLTLDQELQANAAERREILRVACLGEAEWPLRASIPATVSVEQRAKTMLYTDPTVSEMESLCRKMDMLADPDTDEKPERGALADACAKLIRKKQQDGRKGYAAHAARTRHICEEMLGQKIGAAK